jgi:hypothetical protein
VNDKADARKDKRNSVIDHLSSSHDSRQRHLDSKKSSIGINERNSLRNVKPIPIEVNPQSSIKNKYKPELGNRKLFHSYYHKHHVLHKRKQINGKTEDSSIKTLIPWRKGNEMKRGKNMLFTNGLLKSYKSKESENDFTDNNSIFKISRQITNRREEKHTKKRQNDFSKTKKNFISIQNTNDLLIANSAVPSEGLFIIKDYNYKRKDLGTARGNVPYRPSWSDVSSEGKLGRIVIGTTEKITARKRTTIQQQSSSSGQSKPSKRSFKVELPMTLAKLLFPKVMNNYDETIIQIYPVTNDKGGKTLMLKVSHKRPETEKNNDALAPQKDKCFNGICSGCCPGCCPGSKCHFEGFFLHSICGPLFC